VLCATTERERRADSHASLSSDPSASVAAAQTLALPRNRQHGVLSRVRGRVDQAPHYSSSWSLCVAGAALATSSPVALRCQVQLS
jgi:hypothetical protein